MNAYRRSIIAVALFPTLSFAGNVGEEFDLSLLAGSSAKGDLSRLITASGLPVGEQQVDVIVNERWKGNIPLIIDEEGGLFISAQDAQTLSLYLSKEAMMFVADDKPIPVALLARSIKSQFNQDTLQLNLRVPQAALIQSEANYVHPRYWQQGENALILSYNANYYRYKNKDSGQSAQDDFYLNLHSGANVWGWHFRDESNYSYHHNGDNSWRNNTRYVHRGIGKISSDLTIGDFYTPSELFGAQRFRGIALSTDSTMRPTSQQGFAPIVRGVARTNALVRIYQSGSLIYQENVPPGEFAFDTIQPTGSGGDLYVVVQEADGTQQTYSVPFSAVPNMLKEGVFNYHLLAGKSKITDVNYQPEFAQAEGYYGVNNLVTLYGGTLVSNDYYTVAIGSGWNLPFGALSFDISHAQAKLPHMTDSGQSYRIAYSKYVDTTATNFTLAAYRYSTKSYYSFTDFIYAYDGIDRWKDYYPEDKHRDPNSQTPELDLITYDALRGMRPRNTFTLNVNQRLKDNYGSFYITGTQRDYWNQGDTSREYQLGYANSYKGVNYTISVSQYQQNEDETRVYLSLSVPFSLFNQPVYLSSSVSFNKDRYQQANMTLSGSAGHGNQLNYSLSGMNSDGGHNSASANLSYRSRLSTLSTSYSESDTYRQLGLGAQGSIVALPWNIVATNGTGDTFAVIEAPKAKGLVINGDESLVTNGQGLALSASVAPYRRNSFILSEGESREGADIMNNINYTVPYRGSVNRVKYETDVRTTYLLKATFADNSPLPFGTEIVDKNGHNIGYVGQSSMLYLKIDDEQLPHSLYVRTNLSQGGRCEIRQPKLSMQGGVNVCR